MTDLDTARCLRDTGYLARNVLGYDYWENWKSKKEPVTRPGGIADFGPHKSLVDFIDDDTLDALLVLAPRFSLKTTVGTAWCLRHILDDRDIRVTIGMEIGYKAAETVKVLRDHLETNETLHEHFGDDWIQTREKYRFTVSGRSKFLRGATVQGLGVETKSQGDRTNLLWIDDPTSWQGVREQESIDKVQNWFEQLILLIDVGKILVTLTPYAEGDLSFHIRDKLSDAFAIWEVPCGMLAVGDGKGGFLLEGESLWPHLPEERLRTKVFPYFQPPRNFNAQMGLCIESAEEQVFYREQFVSARFDPDYHPGLNAYILTDTATTTKAHGSFTVIALVLLDWDDTCFVVDMLMGRWTPDRVEKELLDFLEKMQRDFTVRGLVMEVNAATKVYMSVCDDQARRRGISIPWKTVTYARTDDAKEERIRGLIAPMNSKKLVFLDTVSRHYEDKGQYASLFDPQGFQDPKTGKLMPDGELVRQFIKWRMSGKGKYPNDVPDCLSFVYLKNAKKERICWPSAKPQDRSPRGRDPARPQELSDMLRGRRTYRHQRRSGNFAQDLMNRMRQKS